MRVGREFMRISDDNLPNGQGKTVQARRRRLGLVVGLVGLILGVFLCVLIVQSPEQPRHNGKLLGEWVSEIGNEADLASPAAKAVQIIGTNAIPWLLEELRANGSWPERFNIAIYKLKFIDYNRYRLSTPHERRVRAQVAFWILGTNAQPAVPELVRLVERVEYPFPVLHSLAGIGPAAVNPLKALITDSRDGYVQAEAVNAVVAAVQGLRLSAAEAEFFLPELIALTNSPDRNVKATALNALNKIRKSVAVAERGSLRIEE
jgi:hypothetical protein